MQSKTLKETNKSGPAGQPAVAADAAPNSAPQGPIIPLTDNHQAGRRVDLSSGKYLKLWQGPQHPGITGNMSLELTVSGDEVVDLRTHVGYLHRGFEKLMERRTYIQNFPIVCRIRVPEPDFNEYLYAATVEELAGIQVPERANWLRNLNLEMARLASFLQWIGGQTGAFGMGVIGQWGITHRDYVLDLFEARSGGRIYHMYITPGGELFEQVQHVIAVGNTPLSNYTHSEGSRLSAYPLQEASQPGHFKGKVSQPVGPFGYLDARQLFDGGGIEVLVKVRLGYADAAYDGKVLDVGAPLHQLLETAVQVAYVGSQVDHFVAANGKLQGHVAGDARVLRPLPQLEVLSRGKVDPPAGLVVIGEGDDRPLGRGVGRRICDGGRLSGRPGFICFF